MTIAEQENVSLSNTSLSNVSFPYEDRIMPLQKIFAAGHISHAYLLLGETDIAIRMGGWFARALNCESPVITEGYPEPCERCNSCKKALHGSHSSIHHITAGNGKQYISIEQIRMVQQQAYLTHLEGNYQVFFIAAEQLREEAANSLLKVLEEPPAQTVFLLYAQKDLDILPTILSRCQIVRLQEGDTAALEQDLLQKAGQWLADFPQLSVDRLLSWGERWDKDKSGLKAFLLAALQCLHENILVAVRQNASYITYGDVQSLLDSAGMIEQTIESLEQNVNQRLLLDVLVLKLKKLLG